MSNMEPPEPGHPDEFPRGMVSAAVAAAKVGLPVERLLQLSEQRLAPHYLIDNSTYGYHVNHLREWVRKNLMYFVPGMDLPIELKVVSVVTHVTASPPASISQLRNLRQLPIPPAVSGVYFLCDDTDVLYVGQRINVGARTGNHNGGNGASKVDPSRIKRIYFIALPTNLLLAAEQALIRALSPEWNLPTGAETGVQRSREGDAQMLELVGFGVDR